MGMWQATKEAIRDEFIDIIEWLDSTRDTLSWRFPDHDKAIKQGAKLIVRESQSAQFVYSGEFGDLFLPGTHTLTTDNIPVLTRLKSWKYGFESPFKADVCFVTSRLFPGNRWGTSNPVLAHDDELGVVRLRAYGTYDVRVADTQKFLRSIVGTTQVLSVTALADTLRSRIIGTFSEVLAKARLPVFEIAMRYREVSAALSPVINDVFTSEYGLEVQNFLLENVSVPAEVEAAIDQRSKMGVIGNLDAYVKLKLAESMGQGGGANNAAMFGAQAALGLALGKEVSKDFATPEASKP